MTGATFSIPSIETERLILRAPRATDLPPMIAFWASDRSQYMGGPRTEMDAWKTECSFSACWITHGYGLWSVEEKATGAFLGRVGLWYPSVWPEPELGWCLLPEGEGKGYAFEAAIAARDWVYDSLDWTSTISLIDVDNTRSIALAERLGATLEQTVIAEGETDYHIYRHPTNAAAAEGGA